MEKKFGPSTLDSQKLQNSPSLEVPLNHFNGSSNPNDADGKKRKKIKHDPYSHNSSLWKNLSYIFSTKTSSSANVKVIRDKESPIKRLSSFFRHKKHNVNTIKPLTNIGISPKGYQVAVSETSMQPSFEKGLAVAVRLPTGIATGSVAVTVEMDLTGNSDELLLTTTDDRPMTIKCCQETDSVTVFTALIKIPPTANVSQLINMPLYLIDSSEKLVLNAGYKLWHETVIKSCEDLEVEKQEQQIPIDDVRIKLTLEKDKRHKGADELHESVLKKSIENENVADVMDNVTEDGEYVNKSSLKEPTDAQDSKFEAVDTTEESTVRNTTSRHSPILKCDSLMSLNNTNDSKIVNIEEAYATLNQAKDFTDDPTEYITEPDEEKTLYDFRESDFNSLSPRNQHCEENEADLTDTDDSIDYINDLSDVTHIIYDSKAYINELSATKATTDEIREIISDSADFINELSVEDATSANIKAIIYDSLNTIDQHDSNEIASNNDSSNGNERNKTATGVNDLEEILEKRYLAMQRTLTNKPEEYDLANPNHQNDAAESSIDDSRNSDHGRVEELEPTHAGDITYNLQNCDYYHSLLDDNTDIYNNTENVEEASPDSGATNKYDLESSDNQRNEEDMNSDTKSAVDVTPFDDISNYENSIAVSVKHNFARYNDHINDDAIVAGTNCNNKTYDFVSRHNTRNAIDFRNIAFEPTAFDSLPDRSGNLDAVLVDTVDYTKEVTDKKASTDIRKAVYELVERTTDISEQNSSIRDTNKEKLIKSDSRNFKEDNEKTETELAEIIYETLDYVDNTQAAVSNVKDMLYSSVDAATKKTHQNDETPEPSMQNEPRLSFDNHCYKKPEGQDALASADEIKKCRDVQEYEERSRLMGRPVSVDDQVGFPMSPYPIPISTNKPLCNTSAQYSHTMGVDDKEVDIQNSLLKNNDKINSKHDTGSAFTLLGSAKFFLPSGGPVATQNPLGFSENDSTESLWPMSSTLSHYSSSTPSYPSREFLRIPFQKPDSSDMSSGETQWPLSSASAATAYSGTSPSLLSEIQPPRGNTSADTTQSSLSGARYIDILPLPGNLKLAARKLSGNNISTDTEFPLSSTSTYTKCSDTLVSFPLSEDTTISQQTPKDDVSEETEWPFTSTSTFERRSDTLLSVPFYNNPNEKPDDDLATAEEVGQSSYTYMSMPSNSLSPSNPDDLRVPVNSPNSYTDLAAGNLEVKPVRNALDFSLNTKCINKISLKYEKPVKTREPVVILRDGAPANRSEEHEVQNQSPTLDSSEEELCSTDFGHNSAERCKFALTNEVDKTLELLKGARSRLSSLTVEKDGSLNNLSGESEVPGGNDSTKEDNKEARSLDLSWDATSFESASTERPQDYKEEENYRRYYEDKDEYYEKQRSDVRCYFEGKNRGLNFYSRDVYNQENAKKNFDSLLSGDSLDERLNDGSTVLKQNCEIHEDKNNAKDSLVLSNEYISDVDNANEKLNELHHIYNDMCTVLDEASDSITNRSKDPVWPEPATPVNNSEHPDSVNCQEAKIANPNECSQSDKKLSEERCHTYMTVENDIKQVIKELLKESEDIKEAAILQGAREEPEPPFSCEYLNFTNEPVIICKSSVEDVNDSTTDSEKNEDGENKSRDENIKDILNVLIESIIKSKDGMDNSNITQTETSQSNDVMKSLSLLTNTDQNCSDIYIGDVNYANNDNKRYIAEPENKHNHINRYITYFCKTTVFQSKIPKTSYSFGEVPCKCSEIQNQIFETAAKPRDSLTITGREHSRDSETSRLFAELLKLKQSLASEKYSILGNLIVPKASMYLPVLKMISLKRSVPNRSDRTKRNGNDKSNSSNRNPERTSENPVPENRTTISGTSSIQKSQKCFKLGERNQPINVNVPATSSAIVPKETRTTDEEEVIENLDLSKEAEASTTDPEYFLPVASAQELPKNVFPEVFESSSSEEEMLPSASKVKPNNADLVEIQPIASLISSDSNSNILAEANSYGANNSEDYSASTMALRGSMAVSNLYEVSKKQAQESEPSDDTLKMSDTEYDGDNETVQIRLTSSSRRYKSTHELNSPQEIAAIEQNVLENDMLTKRQVFRGSSTSSHLEYEDSASITQSDVSIYVLSDDSPDVATVDTAKSTTSSVQQPKIDQSHSTSTI